MHYYEILGVNRECSQREIRAAYRKLVGRLHPDVNPSSDAHRRMAEVNAAYSVLSDPSKRFEYDLELAPESHPEESLQRKHEPPSRSEFPPETEFFRLGCLNAECDGELAVPLMKAAPEIVTCASCGAEFACVLGQARSHTARVTRRNSPLKDWQIRYYEYPDGPEERLVRFRGFRDIEIRAKDHFVYLSPRGRIRAWAFGNVKLNALWIWREDTDAVPSASEGCLLVLSCAVVLATFVLMALLQ